MISTAKSGKNAFHHRFRRIVPVTANATANPPISKTSNIDRKLGRRPMSIMSLANPMVLPMKKTPITEMTSVFRGTVLHNRYEVFIAHAPFWRIVL
jgi:hypothetical protein